MINEISKATTLLDYGVSQNNVIKVRFNNKIEPFDYAIYNNRRYYVIDVFDKISKNAYTLQRGDIWK